MPPRNPDFVAHVREIFDRTSFLKLLGVTVDEIREGYCESSLAVTDQHTQHLGTIHAGVLATLADHTAGGAAGTMVSREQSVVTVEFKLSLLRPARGTRLVCKATVLKAGRTTTFAESEVFSIEDGKPRLAAKGSVTLAVVPWVRGTPTAS